LTTRGGIQFIVRDAVIMVAQTGGESPSVRVEGIRGGKSTTLLLTVGMLANLTRGAMHRRGSGAVIDWSTVSRRNSPGNKPLSLNLTQSYPLVEIHRSS
jgi:hypothetical protein